MRGRGSLPGLGLTGLRLRGRHGRGGHGGAVLRLAALLRITVGALLALWSLLALGELGWL